MILNVYSVNIDLCSSVSLVFAACDNPIAPEIYDCVIQGLKLPADIEVSCHFKDEQLSVAGQFCKFTKYLLKFDAIADEKTS